jgi:hypothetical protein
MTACVMIMREKTRNQAHGRDGGEVSGGRLA